MENNFKKIQNIGKSPKYNLRKLSVGLVSCIVGYGSFAGPIFVQASEMKTQDQPTIDMSRGSAIKDENILDMSNIFKSVPVTSGNAVSNTHHVNTKEEKVVTDETKTLENKDFISDIDNTVLDSEGNFVGKEDDSVSLGGNKDIASKEDLDKDKTVDEFNKKVRAEKEAEYKAEIEKNNNRLEEMNNLKEERIKTRSTNLIDEFKKSFKDDLIELDKYGHYGIELSVPNSDNYESSKNFDWDYYNYYEKKNNSERCDIKDISISKKL